MGRTSLIRWLGLVLLVVPIGLAPAAAPAQCALCGLTPGDPAAASDTQPIEMELETTLDFDRIIVAGNGGGAVRLNPDGTASTSGDVDSISGRARIGRIVIHGAPGKAIVVDFPGRLELTSIEGGTITVTNLVTDLPSSPTLDANGMLVIDFGGELSIDGGAEGHFRGNLMVRADYL